VASGLTKSLITKMTPIPVRQRAVGVMATASALGRAAGPVVSGAFAGGPGGSYMIFTLVLLQLMTVVLGYKALRPYDEIIQTGSPCSGLRIIPDALLRCLGFGGLAVSRGKDSEFDDRNTSSKVDEENTQHDG